MKTTRFSALEKKKSNVRFPCLSFLVCLSSCITPPLLYPRPFSILLVLLLLPSLLMLGRPEAAPGGNNKTQGAQRLFESEEMGTGRNIHRLSECVSVSVCVCVCVSVCVCVLRCLNGLLPDSSYSLPYHWLLYRRVINSRSKLQLLLFSVQSVE